MKEIVIAILMAKAIIFLIGVLWTGICPVIYKQLRNFDIGNAGNGNLNKFDACGSCRFTILPKHLNPFK